MRKLSKSIDEYLINSGWSSQLFLEHAKSIFNDKEICEKFKVEVGRSVIYFISGEDLIKAYVHYEGRSKDYLTFTDKHGKELMSFHYTDETSEIKNFLIDHCMHQE